MNDIKLGAIEEKFADLIWRMSRCPPESLRLLRKRN